MAAGNFIVDRVKLIDAWPSQDALVSIRTEENCNGGGPFNLLMDLARLFPEGPPFPLWAAGLVGRDADGDWCREECEKRGIDVSQLRSTGEAPTSYTDVMTVESTGRRTFFHQRGANARFDERSVSFEGIPARIFYLGYLLLLDALDAPRGGGETGASILLRKAKEAGLVTVVDLVSEESRRFREVITPALPWVDVLLTNEFEAGRLTGMELTPDADLSGAAREILRLGVREAVVIHTPLAATVLARSGEQHAQPTVAIPEGEIRGAVGAGDAFAAGFLLGFHESRPLADCLRLGASVAASCLLQPSASGGILPLARCEALVERWGWRDG